MAVGAIAKPGMQGFLNVLSSGVVGGLVSSGMGGDFWQGFIGAEVAAGVSFAANVAAGAIARKSVKVLHYRNGQWSGPDTKVTSKNRFVNGILNRLDKAEKIAYMEMFVKKGIKEFDLVHVPTRGFWGDALRTYADKMGFTSSTAKQLAGIIKQAGPGTWYAHSYGGVAFTEAVRTIAAGGGTLSGQSVMFLAGANNRVAANYIMGRAGVTVTGYTGSWFDPVPNVVGMNSVNPLQWAVDILCTPLLFTPLSPHTHPPVNP